MKGEEKKFFKRQKSATSNNGQKMIIDFISNSRKRNFAQSVKKCALIVESNGVVEGKKYIPILGFLY